MENIQNLLKKYGDQIFNDRFYKAPNIPEKKLRNVIEKFDFKDGKDNIVMLFDDSLFQDGKMGIIFSGTKMIVKEALTKPHEFLYQDIESSEIIYDDKNPRIHIRKKDSIEANSIEERRDLDLERLNELINQIIKFDRGFKEVKQISTISSMNSKLKKSYVKVIINMTYYNDAIVDEREYGEIISLLARLNVEPQDRIELREYMSISEENLKNELINTDVLYAQILHECPDGNEQAVTISLIKDLINVYLEENNESIAQFDFLNDNKKLFDISDDKIQFILETIINDRNIINNELDDNQIKENMKELVNKSAAIGVPMAAIYMSGSVIGMSAAGITSGLATLGLGGVLGFSGMTAGIGAVVLLGIGAYKGTKVITGRSKIENSLKREMLLQEVLRQNQYTIDLLIDDINYITDQVNDLMLDIEKNKFKIQKLVKKLRILTRAGQKAKDKQNYIEAQKQRIKCPKIIKRDRIMTCTEDNIDNDLRNFVMSCYELENQKYHLKEDLCKEKLSKLAIVLEKIEYFSVQSTAKNKLSNLLGD